MKIQKLFFLSFLFLALFSFSTANANGPIKKGLSSVQKVIKKNLIGVDFSEVNSEETILIDFMLNERAEIIVISTSHKKLDRKLKARLNYKTIESGDLEYFKKYTIPLKFKK